MASVLARSLSGWLALAVGVFLPANDARPDDRELALEAGGVRLVIERSAVESISHTRDEITNQGALEILLTPNLARAVEKMTTTFVGQEMILRYGDLVLMSAFIVGPIPNGEILITPVDWEDAQSIIRKLQ